VLQSFVKTLSRLFRQLKAFRISRQSSSLKATGYKGYNLSMYPKKYFQFTQQKNIGEKMSSYRNIVRENVVCDAGLFMAIATKLYLELYESIH
jgi:hypothetical protein